MPAVYPALRLALEPSLGSAFKAGRRIFAPVVPPLSMTPLAFYDDTASTLYDATSGGSLVALGGEVARWEDQSGNGYHLTQATAGVSRFKRTAGGLVGGVRSNNRMTNAAISFNARAVTWIVITDLPTIRRTINASSLLTYSAYVNSSNNLWGLRRSGSSGKLVAFQGTSYLTPNLPLRSGLGMAGVSSGASGSTLIYNGATSAQAVFDAATITGVDVGGGSTLPLHGRMRAVMAFARELTPSEIANIWNWARAKYSIPVSPSLNLLLSGDSITAGLSATMRNCWPDLLTVPANTAITNAAESSITLASLITTDDTMIDTRIVSGVRNIAFLFAGTNDIFLSSASGATVYSRTVSWCNSRKTAGVNKITVIGMLPRGATDTERQSLRTSMLADFTVPTAYPLIYAAGPGVTYADFYIDLAGDALVGAYGQELTSYFNADNIHPSDTGHAVIAPYAQNALALMQL